MYTFDKILCELYFTKDKHAKNEVYLIAIFICTNKLVELKNVFKNSVNVNAEERLYTS